MSPRYYTEAAVGVFNAVADHIEHRADVRALISLGGITLNNNNLAGLERHNVEVVHYADQWRALQIAHAFVTDHGLASTHESIFNRVPMLSYPFFADQPALAEKCRQFGIAIPLARAAREPVTVDDIANALCHLADNREGNRGKIGPGARPRVRGNRRPKYRA